MTPDETKAKEQGTLEAQSGVVRESYTPATTTLETTKPLYEKDLEQATVRKTSLYSAAGIAPGSRFSDYMKSAGKAPRGFEIEARLALKEEKVSDAWAMVEAGKLGYNDFLYQMYGKDILKADGHDLTSPLYWYNRRKQGLYDSPIDSDATLASILAESEALFQAESFYTFLAKPYSESLLAQLGGSQATAEVMADLFEDQAGLAEQMGSWDKVLRAHKAGMLMGFNPVVDTDGDGIEDMYLHKDGTLYTLADAGSAAAQAKYTASVYRNADGTIDRISIRDSEVGDFSMSLFSGFVQGLSSIIDLGGLAYAWVRSWGDDTFAESYTDYQAWKEGWTPDAGVYHVDPNNLELDNLILGAANVIGNIVGFVTLGAVTGAVGNKLAKVADATAKGTIKHAMVKAAQLAVKVPHVMTNLNGGIPVFKAGSRGFANVAERALINLAVDGAEMWAHMKARQNQTGLSDSEILGKSVMVAGINAVITFGLSGGTDDMGAATRYALLGNTSDEAVSQAIKDGVAKKFEQKVIATNLGKWFLKHHKVLYAANIAADTIENALTLTSRTTMMSTGGKATVGDIFKSLADPNQVLMIGLMSYLGAHGFAGNEGMRTLGAIQGATNVTKWYSGYREELDLRLAAAIKNQNFEQEVSLRSLINQTETTIKTKMEANGNDRILAMLEVLNEADLNFADASGNSIVKDLGMNVINAEKAKKMIRQEAAVQVLFKTRAAAQSEAWADLMSTSEAPGFLKRAIDHIPVLGKHQQYYLSAIKKRDARGAMAIHFDTSRFMEQYGALLNMDANDAYNAIKNDDALKGFMEQHYDIKTVDQLIANSEVLLEAVRTGKKITLKSVLESITNPEYVQKVKEIYGDAKRTAYALTRGAVITVKTKGDPNGADGAANQAETSRLIKAWDALAKLQESPDNPYIIKLSDDNSKLEATYLIVTDLENRAVQSGEGMIVANKFLTAFMVLTDAKTRNGVTLYNALKVLTNIGHPSHKMGTGELAFTLARLVDKDVKAISDEAAGYIMASIPELSAYIKSKESIFVGYEFVKYGRSLEILQEIDAVSNAASKSGVKDKLVFTRLMSLLNDLKNYGKLEDLKKNGDINEKFYSQIQEKLEKGKSFTDLLSLLESTKQLSTASLRDREQRIESTVNWLVKKFGKDNTIDLVKLIEENTTFEDPAEIALVHLRRSLGAEEFDTLLNELEAAGHITRKQSSAVSLDDILVGLKGLIPEADIQRVRSYITKKEPTYIDQFIDVLRQSLGQNLKTNDVKKYLSAPGIGLYKLKESKGKKIYVRTFKQTTFDDFFNNLRTLVTTSKSKSASMKALKELMGNSDAAEYRSIFDQVRNNMEGNIDNSVVMDALGKAPMNLYDLVMDTYYRKLNRASFDITTPKELVEFTMRALIAEGYGREAKLTEAITEQRGMTLEKAMKKAFSKSPDMMAAVNKMLAQYKANPKTFTNFYEYARAHNLTSVSAAEMKKFAKQYVQYYFDDAYEVEPSNIVKVNLSALMSRAQAELQTKIDILKEQKARGTTEKDIQEAARELGITNYELRRQLQYLNKLITLNKDNAVLEYDLKTQDQLLAGLLENLGYSTLEFKQSGDSNIPGVTKYTGGTTGLRLTKPFIPEPLVLEMMPGFKRNLDVGKQLYMAFNNFVMIDQDTIINPRNLMGTYLSFDDPNDLKYASGIVNHMLMIALKKQGKIGGNSEAFGKYSEAVTSGLNFKGKQDPDLHNFMMLEWLAEGFNRMFGMNKSIAQMKPMWFKADPARIKMLEAFGWTIQAESKKQGVYIATGYNKDNKTLGNSKAYTGTIKLTDIIPSNLELESTRVEILNKVAETFDATDNMMMTPGEVLFTPQSFDGRQDLLEIAKSKDKTLTFTKDLVNKDLTLKAMSVKDMLTELDKPEYRNNAQAIMLKNKLKATLQISAKMSEELGKFNTGLDNVNLKKVFQLMQDSRAIQFVADLFKEGETSKLSSNERAKRITDFVKTFTYDRSQATLKYTADRGYTGLDAYDNFYMNGQDLFDLNPDYNFKAIEPLTSEEVDYIQSRMEGILIDTTASAMLSAKNSIQNILASHTIKDSDGDYYLGMGAIEDLYLLDADEKVLKFFTDARQRQWVSKKFKELAKMYPLARSRTRVKQDATEVLSKNQPGNTQGFDNDINTTPGLALRNTVNAEYNKLVSEQKNNLKHRFIKTSSARAAGLDTYNKLNEGIMQYQSDLVKDKVSDPGRMLITNLKDAIATGAMVNKITEIANTIRKEKILTPYDAFLTDDAVMDLAMEIYTFTSGIDNQHEYIKYLIVEAPGVKDPLTGEMREVSKLNKYYASAYQEGSSESLNDFYRVMRDLDPTKEYTVFVMDRSEQIAANKKEASAKLSTIKFKDYASFDEKNLGSKLFEAMATNVMTKGRQYAQYFDKYYTQAEDLINMELSRRVTKRALLENIRGYIKERAGVDDTFVNKLFYGGLDSDVSGSARTLNEESMLSYLKRSIESDLYDVEQNQYVKRVSSVLATGIIPEEFSDAIEFKYALDQVIDSIRKDMDPSDVNYVDGIISGESKAHRINLDELDRLSKVMNLWLSESNDMRAIQFIAKQTETPAYNLFDMIEQRRQAYTDTVATEKETIKLAELGARKKVFLDLEVALRDDNVTNELLQIGAVYEGADKSTRSFNVHARAEQDVFNAAEYSSWRKFLKEKNIDAEVRSQQATAIRKSDALAQFVKFINELDDDVVFMAHNGKQADLEWIKALLGETHPVYLKIKGNFIDTLELMRDYTFLGFTDRNAIDSLKYNMDVLSNHPRIAERVKALREELGTRGHDASQDAHVLRILSEEMLNSDNFLNMNLYNTSLLNKFKQIYADLGHKFATDEEFLKELEKIAPYVGVKGLESNDFTKSAASKKQLDGKQLKAVQDALSEYQLQMERYYSSREFFSYTKETLEKEQLFLKAVSEGGNVEINKMLTYLFERYQGESTYRLTKDFGQNESNIKDFSNMLYEIMRMTREVYGTKIRWTENLVNDKAAMSRESISMSTDSMNRFLYAAAKDQEAFLNIMKSSGLFNNLSIEDYRNYQKPTVDVRSVVDAYKMSDALKASFLTEELYDIADRSFRSLDVINKGLLESIEEVQPGYKQWVMEQLSTFSNKNINETASERNLRAMLSTHRFESRLISNIKQYIKDGTPLHQMTMPRYWGLVTAMQKDYTMPDGSRAFRIKNVEGGYTYYNEIPQGTIVLSDYAFRQLHGGDTESQFRQALKLGEKENLYLTIMRFPADKIDPFHGYNVIVDYENTTSMQIRMNPIDIARHSGDFDGDKITIIKPNADTQKFFNTRLHGKNILDYLNKPQSIFNSIAEKAGSFFDGLKEKFELNEYISFMLKDFVIEDLNKLSYSTESYDKLKKDRTTFIKTAIDSDDELRKRMDAAGMTSDDIDDFIEGSWISKADLSMIDQNDRAFLVNNRWILNKNKDLISNNRMTQLKQFSQQKIFSSVAGIRDTVSGWIQKKLASEFTDLETRPFDTTQLEYKQFIIPSYMIGGINRKLATDITYRNEVIKILKNSLSEKTFGLLFKNRKPDSSLDVEQIRAALVLEEAKIRHSQEYEQVLKQAMKTRESEEDYIKINQNMMDTYEDLVGNSLNDAFIDFNSGKDFDEIIRAMFQHFADDIEENTPTKSFHTIQDALTNSAKRGLLTRRNVYVVIDPEMNVEAGSGLIRREYAESHPNYIAYSEKYNPNKDYSKMKHFKKAIRGRAYFVQPIALDHQYKVASIGNEDIFKSTLTRVDNKIKSVTLQGKEVDTKDIAMYVSPEAYETVMKGVKQDLVPVKLEIDGRKVQAFRTNLAVVENNAKYPDYIKDKGVDSLVFAHSMRSPLSGLVFSDTVIKDVDGELIFDPSFINRINAMRQQIKEPSFLGNNAISIYQNLLVNIILSKIKPTNEADAKYLRTVKQQNQLKGTYADDRNLNLSVALINRFFSTPEAKASFHRSLNKMERKLFSQELFSKFYENIVTGVENYSSLVKEFAKESVSESILSKSSGLGKLEKLAGLKQTPGKITSDVMLDTSEGRDSFTQGYLSMVDFWNYLLEDSGQRISKRDIVSLQSRGLLNEGISVSGSQRSGFNPENLDDIIDGKPIQDAYGKGIKAGNINTSPGVPTYVDTRSGAYSNEITFRRKGYDSGKESDFVREYNKVYRTGERDNFARNKAIQALNRVDIATKQFNNAYDILPDLNPNLAKTYVTHKNPMQFMSTEEGTTIRPVYGKPVEGSLGDAYQHLMASGSTMLGREFKQVSNDIDPSIKSLEQTLMQRLDATDPNQITDADMVGFFDEVITSAKQDLVLGEAQKSQQTKVYRMDIDPVDGHLIHTKKNIMTSSGLAEFDEDSGRLSHVVQSIPRNARALHAEITAGLAILDYFVKGAADKVALNRYAEMKSYDSLLIKTKNSPADLELVMMDMKSKWGFTTQEQLRAAIDEYSLTHKREAMAMNQLVTRIGEVGERIAKETGQVSPSLFHILSPIVSRNNNLKKGDYIHTLKTIFGFHKEEGNFKVAEYLGNKKYDFYNSIDIIADNIAKVGAAKHMSDNLKDIGALNNTVVMEETRKLLDDAIKTATPDPKKKWKYSQLAIAFNQRVKGFSTMNRNVDLNSMYLQLNGLKTDLMSLDPEGTKFESLKDLYDRYDSSENVSDKDLLRELIAIEESIEDLKYEAILENKDAVNSIASRAMYLAKTNNATLVNEYGQKFPTDASMGFYRPIANIDTSFINRNVELLTGGNTFEERLAMAAVTGKLYMLDTTTADHLDKHFFTAKVPGKVMKLLKEISSQTTKLIMSSVPQLINRMINFSAFDLAMMSTITPKVALYAPQAMREFSALLQSNGKIFDIKDVNGNMQYAKLYNFLDVVGLSPTDRTAKGLDVASMDFKVKTPKFLDPYFNMTDKAFQVQTLAGRYAGYLAVLDSFEQNKPIYGSSYYKKEAIDGLKSNEMKAMKVVENTLGAPGGFPFVAKYTQGWAMFMTFPLALARWGMDTTRTTGRILKDIWLGEVDSDGLKTLARNAVGLIGATLVTNLVASLVADMYGVDEDTEEEWKQDQVMFKPVQTALLGRPYISYQQSANPLQNLEQMFIEPFKASSNKTLGKKLQGLFMELIGGKVNPVFKVPYEVATNTDWYGGTPVKTNYSWEDNLARKSMGFVIGIAGATAMVDSWRYTKLDTEDPVFLERLGKSLQAALSAEIGNSKGYKAELKNYYKALSSVNGYIKYERELAGTEYFGSDNFDSEQSYELAKEIRKAMNLEQKPSVIYGLINEAIQNGAGKNEILYSLRSNSISHRLSLIKDPTEFYENLSDKEKAVLDDAIIHEAENYSVLKELLTDTAATNYKNSYVKDYLPRHYNRNYDERMYFHNPRVYNRGNTRYNDDKMKQLYLGRKTFVPPLTSATGSKASGISSKLGARRPYIKRQNLGTNKVRTQAPKNRTIYDHQHDWRNE